MIEEPIELTLEQELSLRNHELIIQRATKEELEQLYLGALRLLFMTQTAVRMLIPEANNEGVTDHDDC